MNITRIIWITISLLLLKSCCTIGIRPKEVSIKPNFEGINLKQQIAAKVSADFTVKLACCPSCSDQKLADATKLNLYNYFVETNKKIDENESKIEELNKKINDPHVSLTIKTQAKKEKQTLLDEDKRIIAKLETSIEQGKKLIIVMQNCGDTTAAIHAQRTFKTQLREEIKKAEHNKTYIESLVKSIEIDNDIN
ncbi:hypothetical protein LPTSP3_g15620 [Leptospira kobayashii]|uniref:Lipoprotein n=2 Tax=Leptospira kobayashii TaxID=1917830 RepID=A0ABN6KCD6_9LEPT|nr:hypothetical protein LPTSP3_g15620 [Leptospira kobayashii]